MTSGRVTPPGGDQSVQTMLFKSQDVNNGIVDVQYHAEGAKYELVIMFQQTAVLRDDSW